MEYTEYNEKTIALNEFLIFEKGVESNRDLDKLPKEEKIGAVKRIRELLSLSIERRELYMIYKWSELLGDLSPAIQFVKTNGITYKDGSVEPCLLDVALKFCDQDTANRAIQECATSTSNPETVERLVAERGMLAEKMAVIRNLLSQYSQIHNLPEKNISFTQVNAAIEISKMDYDLVLCILNGGASLGNLVEIAGLNTRFLEWRKHWKKDPIWRKVGKNTTKPTGANNILVIEDDASTGTTLKAIQPLIKKLNPENVDICFCGMFLKHSIDVAQSLSSFNEVVRMFSLSHKKALDNLDEFRAKLETALMKEN